MATSSDGERQPLVAASSAKKSSWSLVGRRRSSSVFATSVRQFAGQEQEETVYTLLNDADTSSRRFERGQVFLRRFWALLVLQYGCVLFLASPFSLIPSVRAIAEEHHAILSGISLTGIVASMVLALMKGTIYPYAHVSLVLITSFVGLELGLTFSEGDWGVYGLVALGQATTNFCVILTLLQFDYSLLWLNYTTAAILCLFLSGLWMIVQMEIMGENASWRLAGYIALGDWAFTVFVIFSCQLITHHVAPTEYILASLFILAPEALPFLSAKERHPSQEEQQPGDV